MKEIFLLLLLFLFPCSINGVVQQLFIDSGSKNLAPNVFEDNYFYMSANSFLNNYVYFYLKDDLYDPSNVQYCISSSSPTSSTTCPAIKNCRFESLSTYYYYRSNNIREYYYKVELKKSISTYNYVIVKYSRTSSLGTLTAKASYSYLYSSSGSSSSSSTSTASQIVKGLSTVAIVFISIGSVIVAGVIIGLVCYAVKRRQDAENLAFSAPTQTTVTISTPTYPLMGPNNVYTAY